MRERKSPLKEIQFDLYFEWFSRNREEVIVRLFQFKNLNYLNYFVFCDKAKMHGADPKKKLFANVEMELF